MKFGPLAKSETCTLMRGLLDKFLNHLSSVGSEAHVDGTVDAALVVVAVVGAVVASDDLVLEVDVVMLPGEGFEWPLELLYMYPMSLLLPLLSFEWPPDVLSHNLFKLAICPFLTCLCLASLTVA